MSPQPKTRPDFRRDLIAGIIVFLIALPLCLGIAQASGAKPFAGIVAGIIGGIVIGSFSRSHLSVSGPAAGLISIVTVALVDHKQPFEIFLCSVIIAGAIQVVLNIIRAGGIANYFPSSVIEGMLAGIGLTIIIKEFPNAVGYSRAAQHEVATEGEQSFSWVDVDGALHHIEPAAILISAIGLVILILWSTKAFRKVQLIPAGLLVVITGTLLNEILKGSGAGIALGGDRLVEMPVPTSVGDFIGKFTFPDFRGFLNASVWTTGAIIAVVASIESLLCIEATDKLDPQKRYTPGNSELRAQGIGNIISGFIGGLPITSVIIRSSANINAGARSKLSTIIHGSLLLMAAAFIGGLINHVPEACLSAILIFTGYRLCKPSAFVHMWREGGLTHFIPFIVTVVLIPWKGLLIGVGVGMVLAIVFTLRENMRLPYYYQRSEWSSGELIRLTLAQEVSFLNKASIKETLEAIPNGSNVIIDASQTEYIDFDVLDLIRDFHHSQAPDRNIRLSLVGFRDTYKVPKGLRVEHLTAPFHEDGAPKRSTGGFRELISQLRGEKEGS